MIGDVWTSAIDFVDQMDLALSDPPEVVVTAYPDSLLQLPDAGGSTSSFTVTNVGDSPTTVTLTKQGDFFDVAPAVFDAAHS